MADKKQTKKGDLKKVSGGNLSSSPEVKETKSSTKPAPNSYSGSAGFRKG